MTAKLELRGVTKEFVVRPSKDQPAARVLRALDDITLDVPNGEFLTLVGPSGSGKTTLLDILGGLTRPTSGRVRVDGREVTGPGLDRGIVFQQYALFPWRTALGNVAFGLEQQGVGRRERQERARDGLALVGLEGFEDRYPHELSGGMKQRVAIARSLAYQPGILLMDEPFAALDAQTREQLQDELLRIWQQVHRTMVFITHSIEEAIALGDRVVVLSPRPGRIRDIVDVPIPRPRTVEQVIEHPAFVELRERCWRLLRSRAA